ATLDACKSADAVLLGAVGGPKWDDPNAKVRPEQGLLKLRAGLGLFANLRPVRMIPQIAGSSPLKKDRIKGVDILVVRELTGGLYFGEPRLRETVNGVTRAVDSMVYTEPEIRRVVDLAFRLAQGRRRKVTSVDKANILETSRLWRQIATEISQRYPDVLFENQLVDSAAMRLITAPGSFDVIVTENMFGDILTDEASVISGSLGMLPSASLGEGKLGMYEPIHGSAPDIAGKNIANPIGTILSVAMLLRNSLGLEREARAVERAVERAIRAGARTRDLAAVNTVSTSEMGDIICSYIAR
ncbi:MAG: 3-isopropylmalate dehydrogenase, partial [Anaerolineae bacterium]|nr:3-isopropylmalate dehydrogenase [Anaerolineae bacterium]